MIDFDDYLTEIQAPESLRTRVHDLVESYSRVVDVSNAELFVNDVMDEEGNRSFPSMWLFTGDAAYEAELSNANGDELDGTALGGRVARWVSRSRDFGFADAAESSRMHVEIWFSDSFFGELKATGVNCIRLAHILRDHVEANLGRPPGRSKH